MNELSEVVQAALRARREGRAAVLATVLKVEGSAYRRPGARMLLPDGGPSVGMVSGGCLESDLAERARAVLASGRAETVVYDMRSPDDIVWGLGLGCNGEVRVLLELLAPGARADHLEVLQRCLAERCTAVVVTLLDGRRLTLDEAGALTDTLGDAALRAACAERARRALAERRSALARFDGPGGPIEGLVEFIPPPIALLVLGAGTDAVPLVRQARGLGWRVTVADDRPALLRAERFPEADALRPIRFETLDSRTLPVDSDMPVVVMTHHFLHDLDLLRYLLPGPAPYVGLLGPRQRRQNLLAELARRGFEPTPAQVARLYGPVGLDIGSETPEEIALAVLAEIRAVLSRHAGGFLRDRATPLHPWPR